MKRIRAKLLLAFFGMAALFSAGMYRDNPGELRSVLIGREAPALPTTGLPDVSRDEVLFERLGLRAV